MNSNWVDKPLKSLSKGLVNSYEVADWFVQIIATEPTLNENDLSLIVSLPERLPDGVKIIFFAIMKALVVNDFTYQIVSVGGKGRMGNKENLKQACQALKLLES